MRTVECEAKRGAWRCEAAGRQAAAGKVMAWGVGFGVGPGNGRVERIEVEGMDLVSLLFSSLAEAPLVLWDVSAAGAGSGVGLAWALFLFLWGLFSSR